MKKYLLLLLTIVAFDSLQPHAQAPPDSVLSKYHASNGIVKFDVIEDYLFSFEKNDSILTKKSLELIAYFKKQNDDAGADYTQLFLALRAKAKNDFATALNMALPVLSSCKSRNDTTAMLAASFVISDAYGATDNHSAAIKYCKEEIPFYMARRDKRELMYAYQNIGTLYSMAFMPDSGLAYAQMSLNIAYELKNDSLLSGPLSTIAENYIARGDYDLAMPFLKKANQYMAPRSRKALLTWNTWFNNDYAQAYLGMQQYDSSIYYAHRSLPFSIESNDIPQQLRAYQYLYKSFDAMGRQDSSNTYYRLAGAVKDSLFSREKVKAIEAASFSALLRQQELDTEKKAAEDQRNQNLQFALIGFGIISFIIIFLLLSRSFITNTRLISFLGVVALLIVFEFLNLLLHPFLERVTHHSPVLMLLALVCIAALLVPLHHRVEKWATHKLVEKNKQIRLAEAKRTIEKLENNQND